MVILWYQAQESRKETVQNSPYEMLSKTEVQVKETVFERQKSSNRTANTKETPFVFLIQEEKEQEGARSTTHPWSIKTFSWQEQQVCQLALLQLILTQEKLHNML